MLFSFCLFLLFLLHFQIVVILQLFDEVHLAKPSAKLFTYSFLILSDKTSSSFSVNRYFLRETMLILDQSVDFNILTYDKNVFYAFFRKY